MKVLSVVVVFTTLLALVVTWPNAVNPDNELSLQQLDNDMITTNGELTSFLCIHSATPLRRLRSPYKHQLNFISHDLNFHMGHSLIKSCLQHSWRLPTSLT